jgi:two-component SAPR family response regulator
MINILIVEDNVGFRHLLRDLLQESNLKFNLVEVDNPIEGLTQFTKYKYNFDFIISDFFLPIQNGNDFLELVKSHKKNIRCLLISADDSLQSKNYPYVDHFFSKSDVASLVRYLETYTFISL